MFFYDISPPSMNFKKVNYVGRHSAAWRLGWTAGFQTQPKPHARQNVGLLFRFKVKGLKLTAVVRENGYGVL